MSRESTVCMHYALSIGMAMVPYDNLVTALSLCFLVMHTSNWPTIWMLKCSEYWQPCYNLVTRHRSHAYQQCIMHTHCAFCSCAQLTGQIYELVKIVEMFWIFFNACDIYSAILFGCWLSRSTDWNLKPYGTKSECKIAMSIITTKYR